MQSALNLLLQHPFSDEAVFASLALVAKRADLAEFAQRKDEFFQALGGAAFFKRLLMTERMELLALNFLSTFCDEDNTSSCSMLITQQCSLELLQACELALQSSNEKAIDDAVKCLLGLQRMSGTSRFLLNVIQSNQVTDKVKAQAASAFACTLDPFLGESEEADTVKLLKRGQYLQELAQGLAYRWNQEVEEGEVTTEKKRALYEETGKVMTAFLRSKDLDPLTRRAGIRLVSVCLERHIQLLSTDGGQVAAVIANVCSIELQVGLTRVSSALANPRDDARWKQDELDTLISAARALDRIASWMAAGNDCEDDARAAVILQALTSAAEASCAFFVDTKDNTSAVKLKTFLLCFVASCLVLFWMDDPISIRGLLQFATRSGFINACAHMIRDSDQHAVHFLFPLLVQLPPQTWVRNLLVHNNDVVQVICKDFVNQQQSNADLAASRVVYSGMVIVCLLTECSNVVLEEEEDQGTMRNVRALVAPVLSPLVSRWTKDKNLESACVLGVLLALGTLLKITAGLPPPKQYLEECDRMLKNHVHFDGPDDYGLTDFIELGSRLTWKDLRKICEIVRLECV